MDVNGTVNSVDRSNLRDFDIIMGVWLTGFICVLGIIGNFLALLALCKDRSECPTFLSLRALATSDLILLSAAMMQQVVPFYCLHYNIVNTFCMNQGYFRVYAWPVVCIAQMASIWMTVLISSERYIAIVHPLQAVQTQNPPRVQTAILAVFAAAILFNIPKFFEFKPEREFQERLNVTSVIVSDTPLRVDTVYRYLYNTALYCLVVYALPMSILTFLNVRIVRQITAAKRQWENLNRSQQREVKLTILPLCIVLVYFVCSTQSLLAFILDAVFVKRYIWLEIYTAVVNILVTLNSAVNFILMYLFGRKFRNLLAEVLGCSKSAKNSPILKQEFV